MTGYNFTDRVRRGLVGAREKAQRLNHEAVGPEHVLLGVQGGLRGQPSPDAAQVRLIAIELETMVEQMRRNQ